MLSFIQNLLQDVYDLDRIPSVMEYLLDPANPNLPAQMLNRDRSQVVIKPNADEVELGVYFSPNIYQALAGGELSLSQLMELGEETSHFLYVYFNLHNEVPMSLLDIELQGEIDKYIIAAKLLSMDPHELTHLLFNGFSFSPDIKAEEQQRYLQANELGRKFIGHLGLATPSPWDSQVFRRLKAFYRWSSHRRIRAVQTGKLPS